MKTKSRYSSQRVIANKLRLEVESETPNRKEQIMAAVSGRQPAEQPERRKAHRPVLKYTVSFVLVAAVLGGAASIAHVFPEAQQLQQVTASSQCGATLAEQNPFVLKAYAAEVNSVSSQAKDNFGISIFRPVNIYGEKIKNPVFEEQGLSLYDGYNIIKATGDKLTCVQYVGFNIKCVGQYIKSITYTTNKGGFAQIKPLTQEEYQRIFWKNPYWAKRDHQSGADLNYGDGKSMEVENGGGEDAGHGYLPVGNSYTICYADQDNYAVQYAFRGISTVSRREFEDPRTDLRKIPHELKEAIDGMTITITAHYDDGSTASKKCVLKLDKDYWAFRVVEK